MRILASLRRLSRTVAPARSQDFRPVSGSACALESSGWVPQWLKSRLPGSLGGDQQPELTLDRYRQQLQAMRKLGGLANQVTGSSAANPVAQATLRIHEDVIGAMTQGEKDDLRSFDAAARQRAAAAAKCSVQQVEDLVSKFEAMQHRLRAANQLIAEGKPAPKSGEEWEALFRSLPAPASKAAPKPVVQRNGMFYVPANMVGWQDKPCPLQGRAVGRSSSCAASGKKFKNCCGTKLKS